MPKRYKRDEEGGIATLPPPTRTEYPTSYPKPYHPHSKDSSHSILRDSLATAIRKLADLISPKPNAAILAQKSILAQPAPQETSWRRFNQNLLERLIPYLPQQEYIQDPRAGDQWSKEALQEYRRKIRERAEYLKAEASKLEQRAIRYCESLPLNERPPLYEEYAKNHAHDLAVLAAVHGKKEAVEKFEAGYIKPLKFKSQNAIEKAVSV